MTQLQEAHSVNDSPTKQDILKQIVRLQFPYMLYHEYLNRETVCGAIGDRGGGKSAFSAVWALINFMFDDKKVWSNMTIRYGVKISDEMAREFTGGLLKTGGMVVYESLPLDKDILLTLDETYHDGCLVIEEINVQYSNARKFMTNTNVNFNELCQQLRKFKTSLVYNVIDEMFIDVQLRSLTDFFVKTYDTAFEITAMESRKATGQDFSWKIYPMSSYLAGEENKYVRTKKPLPPAVFHFTPWRGLFDTTKHQEKGIYSQSKSSKEINDYMDQWQWLAEKAKLIRDNGYQVIEPWQLPGLIGRPLNKSIKDVLNVWGIHWDNDNQYYVVEDYELPPLSQTSKH